MTRVEEMMVLKNSDGVKDAKTSVIGVGVQWQGKGDRIDNEGGNTIMLEQ